MEVLRDRIYCNTVRSLQVGDRGEDGVLNSRNSKHPRMAGAIGLQPLRNAQQIVNHCTEFIVGAVRQEFPATYCGQARVSDFR